jgi:hypothetical protein
VPGRPLAVQEATRVPLVRAVPELIAAGASTAARRHNRHHPPAPAMTAFVRTEQVFAVGTLRTSRHH